MTIKTTNVRAEDLNYDKYEAEKYDDDIRRVIPGHGELHDKISSIVEEFKKSHGVKRIADLGCGTGITSQKILSKIPEAHMVSVDFSKRMLSGAKKRLQEFDVDFIVGDYSETDFGRDFDIIVSVISIHHQNNDGKRKVFRKIHDSLSKGGIFIFGDLMTHRDQHTAALNEYKHIALLVKNAKDEESLKEWAHHHKFINDVAPLEDQIEWLKEGGFSKVEVKFQHLNTVLLVATK